MCQEQKSSGDPNGRHWNRCANPFDIETEPPLRAQLLRLDEDDHALVIKLHHLVTDGWSQRLFWEELERALWGQVEWDRQPDSLSLPSSTGISPSGSAAWLRTRAAEEQLSYWRAQLEGLTELPLRTDRPRPEMWTGRGATASIAVLAGLVPRHQVAEPRLTASPCS